MKAPAILESRIVERPRPIGLPTGREEVARMVKVMEGMEQQEMPLDHEFQPGLYIRRIHMPADTHVIGHIHKTRHINRVLSGRAIVTMEGIRHEIEAPCQFWSDVGVQKVLYIIEDMVWETVHPNPTDSRDVAWLEEQIIELTPDQLKRKGNMTLDSMRMSVNLLSSNQPKELLPCP